MSERSKKTLVYLGLNHGVGFRRMFQDYDQCFGFEPIPSLYEKLKNEFSQYPHVHIINAAVSTKASNNVEFFITNNHLASSSLFQLKDEWRADRLKNNAPDVVIENTIKVRTILLPDFLRENGIDEIDDYVSDIEGMDLAVLKTLEENVVAGRIHRITCEVSRDVEHNRHVCDYDNSKKGFADFLGEKYELIAEGFMPLQDGVFESIPRNSWAMDCCWALKRPISA